MTVKEIVRLCYGSESNISKVKVIAKSTEVKKLISGNSEDLWSAVNILYFQCDHEMMKKAPFSINKEVFADLKMKIINSRKALEEQFPYGKGGWIESEDNLSREGSCWVDMML